MVGGQIREPHPVVLITVHTDACVRNCSSHHVLRSAAASVPITVDAGRVITDSKDVLDSLSADGHSWLYPSPAVREVEAGFGDAFGRAVAFAPHLETG